MHKAEEWDLSCLVLAGLAQAPNPSASLPAEYVPPQDSTADQPQRDGGSENTNANYLFC